MYDDEDDDDEDSEVEHSPASGGYGGDRGDDTETYEEAAPDPEIARREAAEVARGKDDRAFYDDLAKDEDTRHNAMRKDREKRSLVLAELRQKLRHKEAALREIEMNIATEENQIDFEKKKAYRDMAKDISNPDDGAMSKSTPPLPQNMEPKDIGEEFSVERAIAHIKQMQEEKIELERILSEMRNTLNEEARTLSQLEHQLLRM